MIKHIVMIKLNDKNDTPKIIEIFNTFKTNISEVKNLEHKVNCYDRETNYDLIFSIEFDNALDLETYINCEFHLNAVKVVRPLCASLVAIDFK